MTRQRDEAYERAIAVVRELSPRGTGKIIQAIRALTSHAASAPSASPLSAPVRDIEDVPSLHSVVADHFGLSHYADRAKPPEDDCNEALASDAASATLNHASDCA